MVEWLSRKDSILQTCKFRTSQRSVNGGKISTKTTTKWLCPHVHVRNKSKKVYISDRNMLSSIYSCRIKVKDWTNKPTCSVLFIFLILKTQTLIKINMSLLQFLTLGPPPPPPTLICMNGMFRYQQWLRSEPGGYVFRARNSKTGKWPVTQTIPERPKPSLHHIILGTNLPSITIVYFSGLWCQVQRTHKHLVSLTGCYVQPAARFIVIAVRSGRAQTDTGRRIETTQATAGRVSEGCN